MNRTRHIGAAVALGLAALAGGCSSTAPVKAEQEAPAFTLPNQDGKPIALGQFQKDERWVVVAIYTWAGTSN